MWRPVIFLSALGLGYAVVGAAASLAISTNTLGAVRLSVPRCTTAPITIIQNVSSGAVVSVSVGGLPAECGNALIQVTVNNGTTIASGSATIAGGGGSVTVVLSSAPTVTTIEQTDIVMTGP